MFRRLVEPVLVLLLICLLPGIPPYEKLEPFILHDPADPSGALARNNRLSSAKILFEGSIRGPESIVEIGDPKNGVSEVYTGLQGGAIIKILNGGTHFEVVARTGECKEDWDAEECGRPLGLQSDKQGNILIADAYKGILRLDPRTGKLTTLVNASEPINGRAPGLPNSVDIGSDGVIYWTDSSRYKLHLGLADMLGSATGRLLRYNPISGENTVLLEDLHFANGVQLSPNEDFVVVAECFRHRLIRYWLKGPKGGTREVFTLIPGTPDNLKLAPNGNILVGVVVPRFTDTVDFWTDYGTLTPHPWIRFIVVRLLSLSKMLIDLTAKYLPPPFSNGPHWLSYKILSMEPLAVLLGKYGLIVEVDWNGNIVQSWHNPGGTTPALSEAYCSKDGALWLASPWNGFLARVPPQGPKVTLRNEGDIEFSII